jgi:hypothetical protein
MKQHIEHRAEVLSLTISTTTWCIRLVSTPTWQDQKRLASYKHSNKHCTYATVPLLQSRSIERDVQAARPHKDENPAQVPQHKLHARTISKLFSRETKVHRIPTTVVYIYFSNKQALCQATIRRPLLRRDTSTQHAKIAKYPVEHQVQVLCLPISTTTSCIRLVGPPSKTKRGKILPDMPLTPQPLHSFALSCHLDVHASRVSEEWNPTTVALATSQHNTLLDQYFTTCNWPTWNCILVCTSQNSCIERHAQGWLKPGSNQSPCHQLSTLSSDKNWISSGTQYDHAALNATKPQLNASPGCSSLDALSRILGTEVIASSGNKAPMLLIKRKRLWRTMSHKLG